MFFLLSTLKGIGVILNNLKENKEINVTNISTGGPKHQVLIFWDIGS